MEKCVYKTYPSKPRSKCNCVSCIQSIRDQGNSDNLRKEHKTGRFCKEHNNCPKCCKIKQIVKFLRHASGVKCGKRCEACKDKYYERYMFSGSMGKGGVENNVRRIYLYMLKDMKWF